MCTRSAVLAWSPVVALVPLRVLVVVGVLAVRIGARPRALVGPVPMSRAGLGGLSRPAMVAGMLEELESIDWSRLEHAYGSAADVPDQIRALTSVDPDERDRALGELYSNIFHQGTRYEASAHAVPFLLELVRNPERPDRDLLGLLTSLAIGYDVAWLPDGFPVAQLREAARGGEEVLRSAPPLGDGDESAERRLLYWDNLDPEAEARGYAYVELAAYDAVRAGVPAFVDILAQPDASAGDRTGAAYALAWFPEEASVSVPALARAAADSEPAVAASALVALGLVGGDAEVGTIEAALDDPRDVVRWGAAIALARLRGPAAGPRVAEELLTWARSDEGSREEIPFLDGDLAGYASLALGQLGSETDEAAFSALLTRLPSVSGPEALTVVGEALKRAFPNGPVPAGQAFAALDERQRRLLTALAESPSTWRRGGMSFGNFTLMMREYGLPGSPEEMRQYVDG
jgi:hypothetical protein